MDFDPVYVAALPGLVALGVWALTNPGRFATVAVLGAMIIPVALVQPAGTEVALADVLLLVTMFAWLVGVAIRRAPVPWIAGNPFILPAAAFVGWNTVSLSWSVNERETLTFVVQLVEIVVVAPILFATLPRSLRDLRVGMWFFIACTSVLSVYTIYKYGGDVGNGNAESTAITAGLNKNVIGSFVGAGMTMAYVLSLSEPDRTRRRVLVLAAGVLLAGLATTASRGSLLGVLVALPVASLILGRHRALTFAVISLVAVGYVSVIGTNSTVERTEAGSYDSSEVREYSFENAWDKIQDDPFLGSGAATYVDYIPELDITLPDPNNMFLLTWSELGFVGVLLLLFLFWRYLRLLVRMRRLPVAAATPGVAAGCISLSLFIHFQADVAWTRGTSTMAFAMIGVMLAVERLAVAAQPRPDSAGGTVPRGELGPAARPRPAGVAA